MAGKHLIINAYSGNVELFESVEKVRELLEELVDALSLKRLVGPKVVKGTIKEGVTGFVVIETSHISVHTFTEEGFIAMDVYSCEKFDESIVFKILEKYKVEIKEHKIFER